MAGMAMAFRAANSRVRIIGVEPMGSANMFASRKQGMPVELDTVDTIADGLATKKTDPDVFGIINALADDLVTVNDAEMLDAIRFLLERAKLMAEPAGAATTAALLSGKIALGPGKKVVAVLSGGNFDVAGRLNLGY